MSTAGRWRALLGREAAQAQGIGGGDDALAQAAELLDFREACGGLGFPSDKLQTYVTPITVTRLLSVSSIASA